MGVKETLRHVPSNDYIISFQINFRNFFIDMEYNFNIQSLEIVGDQAMAKVDVPLLAAHFIDFLGLLKEDGEWKIVNKMFTLI